MLTCVNHSRDLIEIGYHDSPRATGPDHSGAALTKADFLHRLPHEQMGSDLLSFDKVLPLSMRQIRASQRGQEAA